MNMKISQEDQKIPVLQGTSLSQSNIRMSFSSSSDATGRARYNLIESQGSNKANSRIQEKMIPISEAQALVEQIELLQFRLKHCENTDNHRVPRYQYLYRLHDDTRDDDGSNPLDDHSRQQIFSDFPEIIYDQQGGARLRSNSPIRDLDSFLARNPGISFIVIQDYKKGLERERGEDESIRVLPFSESIYPVAEGLKGVLESIFEEKPDWKTGEEPNCKENEIHAPFLFIYHCRNEFGLLRAKLPESHKLHLDLLLRYIEERFGDEYDYVDSLLARNMISPCLVHYLFKPGDVVVKKAEENYTGFIAKSWTRIDYEMSKDTILDAPASISKSSLFPYMAINAWSLIFDGSFVKSYDHLKIHFPQMREARKFSDAERDHSSESIMNIPQPISDLSVFPIHYAPEVILQRLKRRGETFWKCRTKRLVSYTDTSTARNADMVSFSIHFLFLLCRVYADKKRRTKGI